MKMNKKVLNILVTGANGYIGMRLIPKLVELAQTIINSGDMNIEDIIGGEGQEMIE